MIFINTCRASMKSFMNTAVLLRPLYSYCYYWSTAVRMQIPSKLQYLASPRLEHLSHIRTYTSRTYQPHAPVLLWPLYSYCYYWSTAVRMQIQSKLQYLASPRLEHLSHIRTYTSRTYQPHAHVCYSISYLIIPCHTLYFLFLTIVPQLFWYSCLLGLLASVTDGLSTCVQEPLAIGRTGCTGRDLN